MRNYIYSGFSKPILVELVGLVEISGLLLRGSNMPEPQPLRSEASVRIPNCSAHARPPKPWSQPKPENRTYFPGVNKFEDVLEELALWQM